MGYFTADTYKNWERIGEPFDKGGKLYSKVKCKCDRCQKGVFVCRVENGQPVPYPAYGGVCLKCGGTGFLTKEVRLYSEAEYNRMRRAAEATKARKEAAREQEMKENFAHNKAVWLETNGFSVEGETYIVTGDSYSIKDQLKEAGFKYNQVLRWHRATADGYEDRVIKVNIDEVIEFSAWGEGHFIIDAKKIIDEKIAGDQPEDTSDWVGEEGKRYDAALVQLSRRSGFSNQFGWSNVYTFKDTDGNIMTWFTAKDIEAEIGDWLHLIGTVKQHSEYKGSRQTILTRCKVERAE